MKVVPDESVLQLLPGVEVVGRGVEGGGQPYVKGHAIIIEQFFLGNVVLDSSQRYLGMKTTF